MSILNNLKIGTRLVAGFVLVIVFGLVVAAVGWRQLVGLDAMVRTLAEQRMAMVQQAGELKDNANVVARGARNIALLRDDTAEIAKERKRIDEMRARNAQLLEALQRLAGSDAERQVLAQLAEAGGPYGRSIDKAIATTSAGQPDEATRILLKETRPLQTAYFKAVDQFKDLQMKLMQEAAASVTHTVTSSSTLMLAVAAVAAVCGLVLAWMLTLSITRPLSDAVQVARAVSAGDLSTAIRPVGRDEPAELLHALKAMTESLATLVGTVRQASDSIATGSGQIATGNADLSQRTEEQASNLQQTAASMDQLSSAVKHNADTARDASQLAREASAAAAQGGEVVGRVVRTMDEISTKSGRIADIIGVIDGIAFQTNLLALNAAVEAARAGEQGRGFAVVAGEVRSLAQRSAQAAREIKGLIGNSADSVQAGATLVEQAGRTMQEIVGRVQRVSELIDHISMASAEQTGGLGQISDAVSQLDTVTQQNAALVEESAAAAESLDQQARRLVQAVSVFRLQGA